MPTLPTPYLYRGAELLTRLPDLINGESRAESLQLADDGFAGVHGVIARTAPDAPVAETRTLTWACASRADLAAVEAFLARQCGRLQGWWCPTFRQDATSPPGYVDGLGAFIPYDNTFGAYLYLYRTAYLEAFPAIAAHRNGRDHWAAFPASGGLRVMPVTAVEDLGDGTMRLNRGGGLTGPSTAQIPGTYAGTRYSRLEFVRLAEDAWTTSYQSGSVATVAVTILSIPRQTP